MTEPVALLYFDFIDPLSYLVERECTEVERAHGLRIRRVPFELCPPPSPLIDPESDAWRSRWSRAEPLASRFGLTLHAPSLIPWTRKAHELVLHAVEVAGDEGRAMRARLFDAALRDGLDIGRVDVLVGLAGELGMDTSRAKAVLDVDRHTEEVAAARDEAVRRSVDDSPSLALESRVLRGFHNRNTLNTFLLNARG